MNRKTIVLTFASLLLLSMFAVNMLSTDIGFHKALATYPRILRKMVIYVDTSAIVGQIGKKLGLTLEDREELKRVILEQMSRDFALAVGDTVVEVTDDPTKKATADRFVNLEPYLFPLRKWDGVTLKTKFGVWTSGSNEAEVYLGEFIDNQFVAPEMKDKNGNWDIYKLGRAIGHTATHEAAHTFSAGHNDYKGKDRSTMTDGHFITPTDRANEIYSFNEQDKTTIKKNWNCPPCKTAVDYHDELLISHYWGEPNLPNASTSEDWQDMNTLFNFSGLNAWMYDFGWLGVDTDGGIDDGNSNFDFIYKSSMFSNATDAEMITFIGGAHDYSQFAIRRSDTGQFFILEEQNLFLQDFVVTPDGLSVARQVTMVWPEVNITMTLNALAYGNYSNAYNGFTYGYVPPDDVAVTDVILSKTVIGQGYNAGISATATNQGINIETFNVTSHYWNGTFTPDQWNSFWTWGDCNRDGYINQADVNIIAANWGWTGTPGENRADINSDGKVDIKDVGGCAKHAGYEIWKYFLPVIDTQTIVDLVSRDSLTLILKWNTTGVPYGNYTITAVAGPIANETNTLDNNCTCSIRVHIGVPGDISGPIPGVYDGIVSMRDISYLIIRFNTKPDLPNWILNADINNDEVVNMRDITIAIMNFNKKESKP